MRERSAKKIVVIGAGVAGLTAAHYLRKHGMDLHILEREAVAGGTVRSILREDKYLLELGPNAFPGNAEPLQRLGRELSIDRLVVGNPETSRPCSIRRSGRNHPLPTAPGALFKGGLLSVLGKARLLAEPLIRSVSPDAETLAAFTMRRAGREVLETLVDPLASGVWAGDAAQLEAGSVLPRLIELERKDRSVLKGLRQVIELTKRGPFSFRWGMGTLTARLEEEQKGRLRLGVAAEAIERRPNGGWRVRLSEWHAAIEADAIIIAAPAHEAARLFAFADEKGSEALSAIPYVPLVVVHLAYRGADLSGRQDACEVVIPRSERIRLLGSIVSSEMFPSRCPRGEVLFTNFIGGATDSGIIDLSDEEVVAEVKKGLEIVMGVHATPTFAYLKRWRRAIPQYSVGHRKRLEAIASSLERCPGIFLVGGYVDGVSVSETIAQTRREVDRVMAYLRER